MIEQIEGCAPSLAPPQHRQLAWWRVTPATTLLLMATATASTVWWQWPWLPAQLVDQGSGFVPDASILLRADGSRWLRSYGPFYHPNTPTFWAAISPWSYHC